MELDMAGDWIPIRLDLSDDPAVILIASLTGLDEYAVVGRLVKFWSWANRHTTDGIARGVTPAWVDHYVGGSGFAQAMQTAGWLVIDSDGVTIPNFTRWNSQSAKNRIFSAKRMATKRGRYDDGVTSAQHYRNGGVTKGEESIEEKRREENTQEPPLAGGVTEKPSQTAGQMRKRFVPPSLEDVRDYCVARGNLVDPQQWHDHYTSNGWLVGKTPMKNWQAAVRTWEKSAFADRGPFGSTPRNAAPVKQRALTDDEANHLDMGRTNIDTGELAFRRCKNPACLFAPCLEIRKNLPSTGDLPSGQYEVRP